MPDETRQAVHNAVDKAPAATIARAKLDAYSRDAAAILVVGLCRDNAAQRIGERMALQPVAGTADAACACWHITQSSLYDRLDVHFHGNTVVSWELHCINGTEGV